MALTYITLLHQTFKEIDPLLSTLEMQNVFDQAQQSPRSPRSQRSSTDQPRSLTALIKVLDKYYTIFHHNRLEKRVINHFFESVTAHMDEYIFNMLMTQPVNTGKGLQVKMSLSFVETWLLEHNFKSSQFVSE